MQKDNRFAYELYEWSNFGKVKVLPSTLKDAGDGVFAECDFSPHDMLSFFEGFIMPFDPRFGHTPNKSYDLNIGNIDGGEYICRGHTYDQVKVFVSNRMMAKNKKSIVGNNIPNKTKRNSRSRRKMETEEGKDERHADDVSKLHDILEVNSSDNEERKVERLINVAQMCNDSLDKRINAEIMCFDTSLIPPEWSGLSTNCARYAIDGEVRFTTLPITTVIYAVKPIKKGQEIFITYGSTYWDQDEIQSTVAS